MIEVIRVEARCCQRASGVERQITTRQVPSEVSQREAHWLCHPPPTKLNRPYHLRIVSVVPDYHTYARTHGADRCRELFGELRVPWPTRRSHGRPRDLRQWFSPASPVSHPPERSH